IEIAVQDVLVNPAITEIEACDYLAAPLATGSFRVDQRLHFVAPLLSFVGPTDGTEIVKRAEYLAETRQIAVERRRRIALRVRGQRQTEQNQRGDERSF